MRHSKYVALADLRSAIAGRKVVRFSHGDVTLEAEPLSLERPNKRTGLVLTCWVIKASDGRKPGMARIPYYGMRDMFPTGARFMPRRVLEQERFS
jgi:hypothetical protein